MNRSSLKLGATQLYQFALGIMTFFYGLELIYLFRDNSVINTLNRASQLLACTILVYIILKRAFKTMWLKYILISAVIILIGLINSRSIGLLRYFLLILAARDIPYKKIIRAILRAFILVLVISIFLYLIGVSDPGITINGGIGLGFNHPNMASLMTITILFLIITLKNHIDLKTVCFLYILAGSLWLLTKTQVAVLCILAFPFMYILIRNGGRNENKFILTACCGSQMIVSGISILLVILYPLDIYTPYRKIIDGLFSYRPYLNFNNIMKYGISIWGQNVQIYDRTNYAYNYFGGFLSNQRYNTVDNAYIIGLITLGIIPMMIIASCFVATVYKAWKNKNHLIVTISVIYAAYGFIENGVNEAFFMFPYLYLLANDDMVPQQQIIMDTVPTKYRTIKIKK